MKLIKLIDWVINRYTDKSVNETYYLLPVTKEADRVMKKKGKPIRK